MRPSPSPVGRSKPDLAAVIRQRSATHRFDREHALSDSKILELAALGTCAPSAFNFQNWRLDAVRTRAMKVRLRAAAHDQVKVEDAAVTFVVSGELPVASQLTDRLAPSVSAGLLSEELRAAWSEMAQLTFAASPGVARDEAVRSASLLACTLMLAAEAQGLATAPLGGFDPEAVRHLLALPDAFVPSLLICVGRPMPGARAQKPRRPISEVLTLV